MNYNKFSLFLLGSCDIYFNKVTEDVFKTWCNCLNPELRGKFKQSKDIDPVGQNRVEDDAIYTPQEKKRIKPSKDCITMYASSNGDAAFVKQLLMNDFGRCMVHVPVSAYSIYDSILYQISHDKTKYKSDSLMQQIAYYMVKWPMRVMPYVEEHLNGQTYESYITNIFHGTQYPDTEVVIAVITKMWNLRIGVVYPEEGFIPFYYEGKGADVVLVCNGMDQPELYFCATKVDNARWRPLKGVDWSNQINHFTNIKNAHTMGEKRLRERLIKKAIEDFNAVDTNLCEMKANLELQKDQLASMTVKIQKWIFHRWK